MFYTYVLKNTLNNKHYVGSTNDIKRRLREHNRGQTRSTKVKGKWAIVFTEEYPTSKDAKYREKQIKSYKGGRAFKRLLRE